MRAGAIEPEGDRRGSHCGGSATWTDCRKSRGGRPARISVASSAKRSRNSAAPGGTVRVGRRRRRRTTMTQPAWNRGDGPPDRRRLDEALDRILEHCRPVEVILFGSAARAELQDSSDIDLLVVLADGDSAEPERMCFDICEAIGCQPRADVAVAFEKEVREAASAWPAPCTPGPRKDPALPPPLAAGLRACTACGSHWRALPGPPCELAGGRLAVGANTRRAGSRRAVSRSPCRSIPAGRRSSVADTAPGTSRGCGRGWVRGHASGSQPGRACPAVPVCSDRAPGAFVAVVVYTSTACRARTTRNTAD